jgi:hypothetical protein
MLQNSAVHSSVHSHLLEGYCLMTKLRQQPIEELVLRGTIERTQEPYLSWEFKLELIIAHDKVAGSTAHAH